MIQTSPYRGGGQERDDLVYSMTGSWEDDIDHHALFWTQEYTMSLTGYPVNSFEVFEGHHRSAHFSGGYFWAIEHYSCLAFDADVSF